MSQFKPNTAFHHMQHNVFQRNKTIEFLNYMGNESAAQGNFDDAIRYFKQAINLEPNFAVTHFNLGNILDKLMHVREALICFKNAISLRPDFSEAHYNMGNVYYKLMEHTKALACYQRAIHLKPDFQLAYMNLGNTYQELGELEDALTHYKKALDINPLFPEALYNLGNILYILGDFETAAQCYHKAIKIKPEFPEAYTSLGNSLRETGKLTQAIQCFNTTLKYKPAFKQAQNGLKKVYLSLVPRWHFVMMNDTVRNDLYEEAIKRVTNDQTLVLEVGTGSGLLAMMAARAGARRVVTCESVAVIAEKAEQIVKNNKLSDKVDILNKSSFDLKIGEDLPDAADVLIAEIFDVGLIGEGIIPVMKHARSNLLRQNAVIIPQRAELSARLIQSRELFEIDRVKTVSGFDLSSFNDFSHPSYFQAKLSYYPHEYISDAFPVFNFDFCHGALHQEDINLTVRAKRDGLCHAVVFWFKLFLDDDLFIDTSPENGKQCWQQAVQIVDPPIHLQKNQRLIVNAQHDCNYVTFNISEDMS